MSFSVSSVSNTTAITKNLSFGNSNASIKSDKVLPAEDLSQNLCSPCGQFNENLTRKVKIYPITTEISMEGDVNGKPVNLAWRNLPSWLGKKENYRGTLGDNSADITIYDNQINGTVGNKELNILFNSNMYGDFSITGKIGDKDMNIVTGSPTASAQGENDVLTLLVSLKGNKFTCCNDKFGKLQTSAQRSRDYGQAVTWGIIEPAVQKRIFG